MNTKTTLLILAIFLVSIGFVGAKTLDEKMDYLTKRIDDRFDRGTITVHGTEYNNEQTAKVWLQLIDSNGTYVNNGVCYTDIYTPDNEELLERATMLSLNHDGIYYYDLPLTDLPEGVYPVIARCYYVATQIYYNVTSYLVTRGTYDSGTLPTSTALIDGNFIRFKEQGTNPTRNITVSLNVTSNICKDVSEALLTGITIRTVTKFDSEVNDDITLSIFNYTSNSWMDLPNKVLEGNAFRDVSNSVSLTNITKSGYSTATQPIRIQYRDVMNLADGATSNLDIDYLEVSCDQLANPEWQEVKGSSEIHITIPTGTEAYVEQSLCGENTINNYESSCSEFRNNLSYANFTWGYIYDKITFFNSYNTNINQIDDYATSYNQDCTGIIDIIETRNGVATSIYDNITFSQGSNDNCIIQLPVAFNETENDFYIEITQENYMKWNSERINDLVNYYRLPIESFCNDIASQSGITYQIPIAGGNDVSTIYASNPILLGCYRSIDDLYWFDYYYAQSETINTTGDYESYLYNIQFYYEELKDGSDAVQSITGTDSFTNVNTLCQSDGNGLSNMPNDYGCALIKTPDSIFGSQEGYIIENLTALNVFNATIDTHYHYTTAEGIDCSAVFSILKQNGTTNEIIGDSIFSSGSKQNCEITIPINYIQGQSHYQIEIYIENYILWDIYWARDNVRAWNDTIVPFCNDVATNNSLTYVLPINGSIEQYRNNSEFYFCYRAMDDLYWWEFFYNLLFTENYTTIGPLESIHYESEFFWQKILNDYNTVKTYQRNLNQIQTLQDILDIRENTANRVWNYNQSRNLTYYQTVDINYTTVAEGVWAYNGTVNPNLISQFVNSIWSYTGSISSSILTAISNAIWSPSNTNMIVNNVWNYTDRNLTYYPSQTDMTNYTLVAEGVWNATARYTHGELAS